MHGREGAAWLTQLMLLNHSYCVTAVAGHAQLQLSATSITAQLFSKAPSSFCPLPKPGTLTSIYHCSTAYQVAAAVVCSCLLWCAMAPEPTVLFDMIVGC